MHVFLALAGNVEGTPIIDWQLALAELQRKLKQPKEAEDTLRSGMGHMEQLHGDLTAQVRGVAEQKPQLCMESAMHMHVNVSHHRQHNEVMFITQPHQGTSNAYHCYVHLLPGQ